MIAYLKGKLNYKAENYIILDVNNVGYQIYLSEKNLHQVPAVGTEASYYIYQHVREDLVALYGFRSIEERKMFLLVTSVSGIGPRHGMNLLSEYGIKELVSIIAGGNVAALSKISGIGRKTAEKIVLDLQDKVQKSFPEIRPDQSYHAPRSAGGGTAGRLEESFRSEIMQALKSLGYSEREIDQTLQQNMEKLLTAESIEEGIKLVLKNIQ